MFKKAALGLSIVGLMTATALAAGTTEAKAGKKFYFSVPSHSHQLGKGGHVNSCRHWKRKWRRTGRQHFLRKYRNCLLHET